MNVVSVNIAKPTTIIFNNKKEQTGIYKTETESVFIGKNGVMHDTVSDRVHHGGEDKACYIFGYNHYESWRKIFPELHFTYGIFGENITLDMVNEENFRIGDILKIGKATVQITQPRQPCYKLGIRFQNQDAVTIFRDSVSPGIYVRVLEEGTVKKDDVCQLVQTDENAPGLLAVFRLIYQKETIPDILEKTLQHPVTAKRLKDYLRKKFNVK